MDNETDNVPACLAKYQKIIPASILAGLKAVALVPWSNPGVRIPFTSKK
jgi:hypothetical protein